MRFIAGLLVGIVVSAIGVFIWFFLQSGPPVVSPVVEFVPRPLDAYTIDALKTRTLQSGPIVLDEAVATASAYTAYNFHFTTVGKIVTGLAHIPHGNGPFPVIVQLRGYVDREKYQTGEGTRRSAQVFAANGFVSLAPDFLGYGGSDASAHDIFEERFQTYTTTLDLLDAIPTLTIADPARVGFWGHSNGGQIALTILEVLGQPIPATLWAPVTKPFPYSILYYTDEAEDRGKYLRRKLSEFEALYDSDLYTMTNFVSRINAPLQIHQGTSDDAVPKAWSDAFVGQLKELGKDVDYFVYTGADHNMSGAWNTVVARDIEFFRGMLGK